MAAWMPAGTAEAHMCLCRHSPGAHKTREPHPCALCGCKHYHDASDSMAPTASSSLTEAANRALVMLAGNPAFAALSREHLRLLAACSRHRLVLAGTVLMQEDRPNDRIYVLARGHVKLEQGVDGPAPRQLGRLRPGDVVGDVGMFHGAAWSVTATAEEDLEVLDIGIDDLKAVFREDPHLLLAFARIMHRQPHDAGAALNG